MNKHIDQYQLYLNSNCDIEVANGLKKLLLECDKNPSISFTSKPSLFNYIEQYLDKPFETLLKESLPDQTWTAFFPSLKLSDMGRINFSKQKNIGNDPREITKSIRWWRDQIYTFRNSFLGLSHSDTRDSLEHTLGTIEMILLHFDRAFLPNRASFPISTDNALDTDRTTSYLSSSNKSCKLCWRNTMKYDAEICIKANEKITVNQLRLSNKYCSYHNQKGKESRSNYIRDRRTQKSFEHELAVLERQRDRETGELLQSKFYPSVTWYQYNCKFRLFSVELRKLAYYLARSGLDKPRKKQIMELHDERKTTKEIAKALDISRQAVLKNLQRIQEAQSKILNGVYLKQVEIEGLSAIEIKKLPAHEITSRNQSSMESHSPHGSALFSRMETNNVNYTIQSNADDLFEEVNAIRKKYKLKPYYLKNV